MLGDIWKWTQVEVRGTEWAPPDTWCHPTCKVGEHVVVLNRSRSDQKNCWRPPNNEGGAPNGNRPPVRQHIDRDENVNGRRGVLNQRRHHPQQQQNHQQQHPQNHRHLQPQLPSHPQQQQQQAELVQQGSPSTSRMNQENNPMKVS